MLNSIKLELLVKTLWFVINIKMLALFKPVFLQLIFFHLTFCKHHHRHSNDHSHHHSQYSQNRKHHHKEKIEHKPLQSQEDTENVSQKYLNLFNNHKYSPLQRDRSFAADDFETRHGNTLATIAKKCGAKEQFAAFNPKHREAVKQLAALYTDKKDLNSMIAFSESIKSSSKINPHLWYASFLLAQSQLSPKHLDMERPSPIYLFPTQFIPDSIIKKSLSTQDNKKKCIVVDENVGKDNGIENALWYFREDLLLNAHHLLWHIFYPFDGKVYIPRRGELFYFFHHDILARYTAERLANGLELDEAGFSTKPIYISPDELIPEGYDSHLRDGVSKRIWAPRPPGITLSEDEFTPEFWELLKGLKRERGHVHQILKDGKIKIGENFVKLNNSDHIDIIGELAESSIYSINPDYYGRDGVHNNAHWTLANLLQNIPKGNIGVMGHTATAMRDPVFFRLHQGVDTFFTSYKTKHLPPYNLDSGEHKLVLEGIQIKEFEVKSINHRAPNRLDTFYMQTDFVITGGLDLNLDNDTDVKVKVCAKHLNHDDFAYKIVVDNNADNEINAMVRIFMAPIYKPDGSKYKLDQQRLLFFALDAFPHKLPPKKSSKIKRKSVDSTVTAPWPKWITQYKEKSETKKAYPWHCECGYPHHLLLPRGKKGGMLFNLFVILTDASEDINDPELTETVNQNSKECIPSHIHCGFIGRDYPDNKPMGYPFDRVPYKIPSLSKTPTTIEEYTKHIPNSFVTKLNITHHEGAWHSKIMQD